VAESSTNYLKVFADWPPEIAKPEVVRPEIEGLRSLGELLRAFGEATGWSLHYIPGPETDGPNDLTWSTPVNPGVGIPPGHLRLDSVDPPMDVPGVPVDATSAQQLASALGQTLSELLRAQHVLWQREAELAAGVPLVPHHDQRQHLAARLEAVLQGGAEAVGCQAAALYLLDEATSELKLRSCWGLPRDRLTRPARALQGAMADLEALLGHAVVLEDAELMQCWKVPEDFASAVCVPVSSPTTILGTLWVFCREKRDFNDHQTNMLEVVAGRLAADLEREMLMREGIDGVHIKRQLAAAERLQRGGLPSVAPLLDNWDVAGWTAQADAVGGDFFDWFCLPDGLMSVAVGDVLNHGIEAALSAGAVKTALRSHAQYQRDADRLLGQVNMTLWTGSAGDQSANLFCGLVETATGGVRFASAGLIGVVVLHRDGWESLSQPSPPLGEGPAADYHQQYYDLEPGESLVIFTDGVRDALDQQGRPLGESGLAEPLAKQVSLPAEQLVALARDRLEAHAVAPGRNDRTILVIKRTTP
jgi:serine phosphatase RsbU (regulator of sigma subunit)